MATEEMDASTLEKASTSSDVVGAHTIEALKLLAEETRLAILLTLWEAENPFPGGSADTIGGQRLTFSKLRTRVGMRDSGKFNYHLGMLEGKFVESTTDGYQLLPAGKTIIRAVVASSGFDSVVLEPREIEVPCGRCGGATALTFQRQRLYHVCTQCTGNFSLGDPHPDGVLGGWLSNPAALRHRSPEEVYEARKTELLHHNALKAAGVCPECMGAGTVTFHSCEDHDADGDGPCPACGHRFDPAARFVCDVCKSASVSSVEHFVWHHPAVIAFFYDHDIELGYPRATSETAQLLLGLKEDFEPEVVSTDPLRVTVPIRYEGDEIAVTLDEHAHVIETERSKQATATSGR